MESNSVNPTQPDQNEAVNNVESNTGSQPEMVSEISQSDAPVSETNADEVSAQIESTPVVENPAQEEPVSVEGPSQEVIESVPAVEAAIVHEEVIEHVPSVEAAVVHDEEVLHLQEIAPEAPEEMEVEPLEDFGSFSKEDLVARMEAYSKENNVNTVKNRVNLAKDAFQSIYNLERDTAFASFTEAGGIKEEFDYQDPLEVKFFEAYKYFQKRRSEFVLGQEKLRQENLKAKNEILQSMKAILQKEEDMSKAFNEFHDLQAKWRSIGPVPPQFMNDLWMTYKLYSDRFYEFIKLNRELQDLEMKKNLEMKLQLCERSEELFLEPSLNKALIEIQSLQHKWREIGAVPREKRTEVWIRFKGAVDKIYENKRTYLDSQRQVFEANLAAKLALCEKADAIIAEKFEKHTQWQDGLARLMELQTEWRKIGPTPKDQNDSIWQRFKTTCDQFFKNKDNYYKTKKQEYATNLQQKTELCIQAEALKESSDWKATTQELIRLQQEWKKVGPAGEKNEKIWQRFKAVCDEFFARKTAHFADQDQSQGENLVKKNELISAVEKFEMPTDPNEAIEQLKSFQRSFTEIGLVPIKQKEDIQTRFRNAIQVHFDALKSKPEYRQSYKPRTERPDRGDRLERVDRGDRPQRSQQNQGGGQGDDETRNLKNKVEKLNSEVQVWENNLGFFANSKNANALKEEYEQKIQQAKEEISKMKLRMAELRNVQ
jgi:hypothetical protein